MSQGHGRPAGPLQRWERAGSRAVVSHTGYFFDFVGRPRTSSRPIVRGGPCGQLLEASCRPVRRLDKVCLPRWKVGRHSRTCLPRLNLAAGAVLRSDCTGLHRHAVQPAVTGAGASSSASSRRFKVSERFLGSVTLGCSKGSLSGIEGRLLEYGSSRRQLCKMARKPTYAQAGDRRSANSLR